MNEEKQAASFPWIGLAHSEEEMISPVITGQASESYPQQCPLQLFFCGGMQAPLYG
jgi:hypothetical protein